MEFSALLIFAVWTSSMIYLTFGKERERAMVFPDYYFFAERRLVNHTIEEKPVDNLDDCELMCYLDDDCNACDKSPCCDNNETCQSGFTVKGYRCLCPPGFAGERCEMDIDECSEAHAVKMNKCHPNASCTNTQGSYNCSCNPKYIGNGFNCKADQCYHYQSLSDASRKSSYTTPQSQELCDKLPEGWYRFVGAAGTKMPTTRVPEFRCGTAHSGWLMTAHPTVEDGEALGEVCFTEKGGPGCKKTKTISIQNCGSYFIYKLSDPPVCSMRYCGTD